MEQIVTDAVAAAPAAAAVPQPDLVASVEPTSKKASIALGEDVSIAVTPKDTKNSISRLQPDGVQVLTVLAKGDKARYKVEIPAGTRLIDTCPGFDVMADGPEGPVLLASIDAPWAVDAVGRRLATSYSLHGDTIVQRVDTSGAVYPIVADPRVVRKWYGWQVRFSAWETKTAALGAGAAAYVASLIPEPAVIKAVAAVAGAVALWAAAAMTYNKCIAINVPYFGHLVPWYWSC